MFDLEKEIARWKKTLQRSEHLDDSDLAEQESHFRDEIDHLLESGLDPESAFQRALKSLAPAEVLGREYEKFRISTDRRPSWYPSRLISALAGNSYKTAVRIAKRQITHSLIATVSLAIGIACFALFYFNWQYERSYDKAVPGAGNIFRVDRALKINLAELTTNSNPCPLAPAALALPEVRGATRWYEFRNTVVHRGDRLDPFDLVYGVDEEFFKVFEPAVLKGDPAAVAKDPSAIVLSERVATAIFGSDDPLGKPMNIALGGESKSVEVNLTVVGILENPPANATYKFDIIVSFENVRRTFSPRIFSNWMFNAFPTFLALRPEASLPEVARKLDSLRASSQAKYSTFKETSVLRRLSDLHLSDPALRTYIMIFGTIALAVLLLACINYINLTTARALNRAKEVAVKKIVGAGRVQLVLQFMAESLFATCAATLMALAILSTGLPFFRSLTGRDFEPGEMDLLPILGGLAGLVLLVALISGTYPALRLSSVRLAELFHRNRSMRTSRSLLRKSLVCIQFAVSGALLVVTLAAFRQLAFLRNADLGMETENLVVLRTEDPRLRGEKALAPLKAELSRSPAVLGVSSSRVLPPEGGAKMTVQAVPADESGKMLWTTLIADEDFAKTFGLTLLEGRFFSEKFPADDKTAVVVNEAAARALGTDSAVGKTIQTVEGPNGEYRTNYVIIGVVKNFHAQSLHYGIEPLFIVYYNALNSYLTVRIRPASVESALQFIKATWARMLPDIPLALTFFDDRLRSAYASDERFMRLACAFSGLSVLIGCLGLFGLVTYSTRQRKKEMGIRKVLGSSTSEMMALFLREFAKPVALSLLLAWPVSYFIAQRWLQTFAYRTTLPAGLFLADGAGILAIAFLTVAVQVFKAVRETPVEALRYE